MGGVRGVRGSIPAWSGLGWAGLMRCWYLVWVTVDDDEEARQGGRLSGFGCGHCGCCGWGGWWRCEFGDDEAGDEAATGMSRADEMLVSGVGDCWWRRGSQTRRSFVWVRVWIMRMLRMMKVWVWWWWGRWWSRYWWCCFLWQRCWCVLWRRHCESGYEEDDDADTDAAALAAKDAGSSDDAVFLMRMIRMMKLWVWWWWGCWWCC